MAQPVDVRDTEAADLALLTMYTQFGKASHFMAVARYLERHGVEPDSF
jgi:hypothetical protein